MKIKEFLRFILLISITFGYNIGYSSLYFSDGLSISGTYSNQEEDGGGSNSKCLGLSYSAFQAPSNERPTLSGIYEISGFYNHIETDDGLNMEMLSGGLNYYSPNNLKFGFHHETLYDFSGQELDDLINQGFSVEMKSSSNIISIGFYNDIATNITGFIDIMNLDVKYSMDITFNGQPFIDNEDNENINLLRIGTGYKINNSVFQFMVTMNEDQEKRYSLGLIHQL